MKKVVLCLLFPILFLSGFQSAAPCFPMQVTANTSFEPGEHLTYKVHYGWLDAGVVFMKVDQQLHIVKEKACYKIEVGGESTGLLHLFLKMKNHFCTYLDIEKLVPQIFYREVHEGNYKKNERVDFDHTKHCLWVEQLADSGAEVIRKNEFSVGENLHLQDIVSTWYLLRNVDFRHLPVGDVLSCSVFFDDILYENFQIKFLGKKTIKTKLGTLDALLIAPVVPFGSTGKSVFAGENSVELFLSDDDNKIPLKIKVKLLVGAVEIDLVDCQGLKHPIKNSKKTQ